MDTNYNFVEDMDAIENYVSKIDGGEVFISKDYWDEGIAIVYINNLEKRNAISGKMMVDFRKVIKELENWADGKAVLLTGLGENFSSGGDLTYARTCCTPKEGFYMSAIMQNVLKRFKQLPMLTVTLLHGPTLGGAAEISIFADDIIVSDNVKLCFVHGKMGIITAWGGTTRLVQLLGERKALDLLLQSRLLSSQDCLDLGLATKIVTNANKLNETLDFIRERTKHDKSVVRSFKKAVHYAARESFENSLLFERDLFVRTWGAGPNKEALSKNLKHVKNKI